MAGASGNHLLYQQTFQPADNLYFRLQEGLQRARYGDFMAALVLHTTVILEQANVLRELVQDSRALYNKVIENTQAVKGLEAKTAAIERQIIEQNLHLRDVPPCQPTSYTTYPTMGEQQVHVMCAREQPRSRADQPPLVSLARMTHSQQHMEDAYQRQTMINRPPSRSQTSYPPPPPPLVPHPSSNSYSFLNSGNYPTHRPFGNVAQPPRLYPIPSNRAPQPTSSNVRYPVHSLSRLPPPAILPPPDSYRPLPVTSQSITISTVITTTASSSSSSTTTASPSSLSSPSESAVLPNLVLPAGITIIPLGPVTSSSTESSHTNQHHRRESPIRNLRPSVVIQPIPDESDKSNEFERDSPSNDLSRRKRRLMPVEMSSLRVLRRFAVGDDEGEFSRELLPYDNQTQRTLPEVDLVPLKQVPLQTPDETIITPGILQHAHLVQTSLVSTVSSRADADVAPPTIKKASQNKGLNLECLLQRIAEYTQNKPAPEVPPVVPDKNTITTLSVGSRRRKSLTKLTRDKIRQQSARTPEAGDSIEELGIPTCENVFRNSENVIDAGIPIIVSVEGSVDVNKFLDDSNEQSQSVDDGTDKNAINPAIVRQLCNESACVLDDTENKTLSVETAEADMEVSSIIKEFKSIAISPQSEKRLRKNPIIVLSRCDQAPPDKLSARLRATAKVVSVAESKLTSGRATPPHDLDSAVTEIVTELVSYIEMRNTCSPAPLESETTEPAESASLPVVTTENVSNSSSSNNSSLQPKSMTIQHFDVFCVTRDNILKVHNNDFSSTELPQVPTPNRLSPDAENSTIPVMLPTKFPTIMEVPEPELEPEHEHECERSCQEITKPMQDTESSPATTCTVLQESSIDTVDITAAGSSTTDTRNPDVSNIIVTSVSSIMDEAFHSPSTPQDYAAKLLAKLKTIIPDIRVTPVSAKSSTVNREIRQAPRDDVITIQCTNGPIMSTASGMVTSVEAEKVVSSDCTLVTEGLKSKVSTEKSFSEESRNTDVSAADCVEDVVVDAFAAAATSEIPKVVSSSGNDLAEDVGRTVHRVVNKIMRTVAANITDSNYSNITSIDTNTENPVAEDVEIVTAVDSIEMVKTMGSNTTAKSSAAAITDVNIYTEVAAIVKDISNNVASYITESVDNTTANTVSSMNIVINSDGHVESGSITSAVPNEIGSGTSVITVDTNEDGGSNVSLNSVDRLVNSLHSATKTGFASGENQPLKSVNKEAGFAATESNLVEVTSKDSDNIVDIQSEITLNPTLVDSRVSKSKPEQDVEIHPVDDIVRNKTFVSCQNVGDTTINSAEKLAEAVPVVRRVKLVRPVYSISSSSKTASGCGENENQTERLISVITTRPPKLVTPDVSIIPCKPHSPLQLSKAVSQETCQPSQHPTVNEPDVLQEVQQQLAVNVSLDITAIRSKSSPDVTSVDIATVPDVEFLSRSNSDIHSDFEVGTSLPTVSRQNKDLPTPVSITTLKPEMPCVEMDNEVRCDNLRITDDLSRYDAPALCNDASLLEQMYECSSTESLMKPVAHMAEQLPAEPSVPYLDPEAVEKIVGDLVSMVSLDAECPVPTIAEPTATMSAAAGLIETLPITCVQPSAAETAIKQRLPARKPKLNLWGASGYRTRKKRRKARVKPDSLVAAATADKSVIASMTTDVSQQLKKKRVTTKSTSVESQKGDSTGSSLDIINSETDLAFQQTHEKDGRASKTPDSSAATSPRSSVYLGVTVEGQAEVELRTSSKGRVSLFKVVTRDRKTRRSRSTDRAQAQMESTNQSSSRKKSEAENRELSSSISDEVVSTILKSKRKAISSQSEEMENRATVLKVDKSSTRTSELSSTELVAKDANNHSRIEEGSLESVTKRKRGRPKDSSKSPKSKKASSNMLKISQDTSITPSHLSETTRDSNCEQQLRLEEAEVDNRMYRVVRSGAHLMENMSVLSDKQQQTQPKRLESILVTTRLLDTQDNAVQKDGGVAEASYTASCSAVTHRSDSDAAKVAEDGSYTGALRLVIKGPGISRGLQEHRLDTTKKTTKLHRKGLQPKTSSKDVAKSTSPQVSTADLTISSAFAENSNHHTVANNSSLSVLPTVVSPSITNVSLSSHKHLQEVSKKVKETTSKATLQKINSREGAQSSSSYASSSILGTNGEQNSEALTNCAQAELVNNQLAAVALLPVSHMKDVSSTKHLLKSTNKTKTRKKASQLKSDTKARLKIILPQIPNSLPTGVQSSNTLNDSVQDEGLAKSDSDKNALPVTGSAAADSVGGQIQIPGATVITAKTRRKGMLSKVNSMENVRNILPKPSTTAIVDLQDSETILSQEQKRDNVIRADTDNLPAAINRAVNVLGEHTTLQEDTSTAPKTRRKNAQTKAMPKSGTKSLPTPPSTNVPSVANNCSNVDSLSPVDTRTDTTSTGDNIPTRNESLISDRLQLERAKLQEAVKKATTKTRRKIAQLKTAYGESAKPFAILPPSLSVNLESRTSAGESECNPPAEVTQSLDGNMQSNELRTKDVPLQTPSCSQGSSLDDDIVEVITARVRTLESGDPDYAIISLLQELIEVNDPSVVPMVDSASADTESMDSVGAKTLTRAIRIWQEHDYSRFPIEVLKLSENEQEASQSHSTALSSKQDACNVPCSQPDEGVMNVAESSRMTIARSAIEKLLDADARRKAGEETQPPSSIANTLRRLLTRVQDQSTSTVTTLDNDSETDKNKTVSSPDMTVKSSCSECASGPSGVKCNHVISVSASSASRLLSLLTQASHKVKSQQTNSETVVVGSLPSSDATASTLNSELNVLRDEDTGDESSNSGQALNFKQLLQNRLQNRLKIDSPASDSSDVETDDRYKTLLKTFINKKTVITEKNACYVTPERNLNIKTLKHRLSFAIAGGVSTNSVEEHEESFALQPQVQCVNIFSIHEIWKYLKCFINDSSRASLSLHQLGQKEMQQFLVLAKLCCLGAHKDETDLIFEKTEQTQDLTVDMLEEAIKLLEEGNVE